MNHLVIDLEMCKVPKNYRGKNYKYASEIIQVGAVLLDEEYKEIGTLCQYVHPEFGILDYFITNLTGIEKGQMIVNAQQHPKPAPVLFQDCNDLFRIHVQRHSLYNIGDYSTVLYPCPAAHRKSRRLRNAPGNYLHIQSSCKISPAS